jgi:hypothetical protein
MDAALFRIAVGSQKVHIGIHVDDTLITYEQPEDLTDLHSVGDYVWRKEN